MKPETQIKYMQKIVRCQDWILEKVTRKNQQLQEVIDKMDTENDVIYLFLIVKFRILCICADLLYWFEDLLMLFREIIG